jgi:hypothetical protein
MKTNHASRQVARNFDDNFYSSHCKKQDEWEYIIQTGFSSFYQSKNLLLVPCGYLCHLSSGVFYQVPDIFYALYREHFK